MNKTLKTIIYIAAVIIIVAVTMSLKAFVFGNYTVKGDSMNDTLSDGDVVWAGKACLARLRRHYTRHGRRHQSCKESRRLCGRQALVGARRFGDGQQMVSLPQKEQLRRNRAPCRGKVRRLGYAAFRFGNRNLSFDNKQRRRRCV